MTIYFLVAYDPQGLLTDDIVKIGYTAGSTYRRHADVGTSCPFPLELYTTIPGSKATEKEIHRLFAKDRIHKEWFRWTAELEDWIDEADIDATS